MYFVESIRYWCIEKVWIFTDLLCLRNWMIWGSIYAVETYYLSLCQFNSYNWISTTIFGRNQIKSDLWIQIHFFQADYHSLKFYFTSYINLVMQDIQSSCHFRLNFHSTWDQTYLLLSDISFLARPSLLSNLFLNSEDST